MHADDFITERRAADANATRLQVPVALEEANFIQPVRGA